MNYLGIMKNSIVFRFIWATLLLPFSDFAQELIPPVHDIEEYENEKEDDNEEPMHEIQEERGKRLRLELHESDSMEGESSQVSNNAIMDMLKEMSLKQDMFQSNVNKRLEDMHSYNVARFDHLQNQVDELVKQNSSVDHYFNLNQQPDDMNEY
jgi:TolA-binding protein